jgi:WD40 repeat protein
MPSEPHVIEAHGKHAQAVAFTGAGKRLVSTGQDACVRLWSVPSFRPEGAFTGHGKCVNTLSFTLDERALATGASDSTVRLWSFPAGERRHVLEKQTQGAFGPDGHHVATISSKGTVVLWDAASGAELRTFEVAEKRLTALVFGPTGSVLFAGGTGPIHRLSVPDGTSEGMQRGHEIAVACLRVSPNGSILGSSGADGTLRFWTVVGGDEVNRVRLQASGIFQLAFAPDGRRIAVSTDHAVVIHSVPDGDVVERFDVPVRGVYGVAISPDGRYLANAAADGRVRVWTLE